MKPEEEIVPVRDFVLVRYAPEGVSAGGIVIPDSAQVRNRGEVLACGEGRYESGHLVPMCVKPGQMVVIIPAPGGKIPGIRVLSERTDGVYALVHAADIMAVDNRATLPDAPRIAAPSKREEKLVTSTKPRLQ